MSTRRLPLTAIGVRIELCRRTVRKYCFGVCPAYELHGMHPGISESFERRAKNALSLLLQDSPENEDRKRLFVDAEVQHLQMLYKLLPVPGVEIGNKRAEATLMEPIYPASVLQDESRSWLKAIHRRLAQTKSIRSPYYVEISRDFPYEIFSVIAKIVGRLDGSLSLFVSTVTTIRRKSFHFPPCAW